MATEASNQEPATETILYKTSSVAEPDKHIETVVKHYEAENVKEPIGGDNIFNSPSVGKVSSEKFPSELSTAVEICEKEVSDNLDGKETEHQLSESLRAKETEGQLPKVSDGKETEDHHVEKGELDSSKEIQLIPEETEGEGYRGYNESEHKEENNIENSSNASITLDNTEKITNIEPVTFEDHIRRTSPEEDSCHTISSGTAKKELHLASASEDLSSNLEEMEPKGDMEEITNSEKIGYDVAENVSLKSDNLSEANKEAAEKCEEINASPMIPLAVKPIDETCVTDFTSEEVSSSDIKEIASLKEEKAINVEINLPEAARKDESIDSSSTEEKQLFYEKNEEDEIHQNDTAKGKQDVPPLVPETESTQLSLEEPEVTRNIQGADRKLDINNLEGASDIDMAIPSEDEIHMHDTAKGQQDDHPKVHEIEAIGGIQLHVEEPKIMHSIDEVDRNLDSSHLGLPPAEGPPDIALAPPCQIDADNRETESKLIARGLNEEDEIHLNETAKGQQNAPLLDTKPDNQESTTETILNKTSSIAEPEDMEHNEDTKEEITNKEEIECVAPVLVTLKSDYFSDPNKEQAEKGEETNACPGITLGVEPIDETCVTDFRSEEVSSSGIKEIVSQDEQSEKEEKVNAETNLAEAPRETRIDVSGPKDKPPFNEKNVPAVDPNEEDEIHQNDAPKDQQDTSPLVHEAEASEGNQPSVEEPEIIHDMDEADRKHDNSDLGLPLAERALDMDLAPPCQIDAENLGTESRLITNNVTEEDETHLSDSPRDAPPQVHETEASEGTQLQVEEPKVMHIIDEANRELDSSDLVLPLTKGASDMDLAPPDQTDVENIEFESRLIANDLNEEDGIHLYGTAKGQQDAPPLVHEKEASEGIQLPVEEAKVVHNIDEADQKLNSSDHGLNMTERESDMDLVPPQHIDAEILEIESRLVANDPNEEDESHLYVTAKGPQDAPLPVHESETSEGTQLPVQEKNVVHNIDEADRKLDSSDIVLPPTKGASDIDLAPPCQIDADNNESESTLIANDLNEEDETHLYGTAKEQQDAPQLVHEIEASEGSQLSVEEPKIMHDKDEADKRLDSSEHVLNTTEEEPDMNLAPPHHIDAEILEIESRLVANDLNEEEKIHLYETAKGPENPPLLVHESETSEGTQLPVEEKKVVHSIDEADRRLDSSDIGLPPTKLASDIVADNNETESRLVANDLNEEDEHDDLQLPHDIEASEGGQLSVQVLKIMHDQDEADKRLDSSDLGQSATEGASDMDLVALCQTDAPPPVPEEEDSEGIQLSVEEPDVMHNIDEADRKLDSGDLGLPPTEGERDMDLAPPCQIDGQQDAPPPVDEKEDSEGIELSVEEPNVTHNIDEADRKVDSSDIGLSPTDMDLAPPCEIGGEQDHPPPVDEKEDSEGTQLPVEEPNVVHNIDEADRRLDSSDLGLPPTEGTSDMDLAPPCEIDAANLGPESKLIATDLNEEDKIQLHDTAKGQQGSPDLVHEIKASEGTQLSVEEPKVMHNIDEADRKVDSSNVVLPPFQGASDTDLAPPCQIDADSLETESRLIANDLSEEDKIYVQDAPPLVHEIEASEGTPQPSLEDPNIIQDIDEADRKIDGSYLQLPPTDDMDLTPPCQIDVDNLETESRLIANYLNEEDTIHLHHMSKGQQDAPPLVPQVEASEGTQFYVEEPKTIHDTDEADRQLDSSDLGLPPIQGSSEDKSEQIVDSLVESHHISITNDANTKVTKEDIEFDSPSTSFYDEKRDDLRVQESEPSNAPQMEEKFEATDLMDGEQSDMNDNINQNSKPEEHGEADTLDKEAEELTSHTTDKEHTVLSYSAILTPEESQEINDKAATGCDGTDFTSPADMTKKELYVPSASQDIVANHQDIVSRAMEEEVINNDAPVDMTLKSDHLSNPYKENIQKGEEMSTAPMEETYFSNLGSEADVAGFGTKSITLLDEQSEKEEKSINRELNLPEFPTEAGRNENIDATSTQENQPFDEKIISADDLKEEDGTNQYDTTKDQPDAPPLVPETEVREENQISVGEPEKRYDINEADTMSHSSDRGLTPIEGASGVDMIPDYQIDPDKSESTIDSPKELNIIAENNTKDKLQQNDTGNEIIEEETNFDSSITVPTANITDKPNIQESEYSEDIQTEEKSEAKANLELLGHGETDTLNKEDEEITNITDKEPNTQNYPETLTTEESKKPNDEAAIEVVTEDESAASVREKDLLDSPETAEEVIETSIEEDKETGSQIKEEDSDKTIKSTNVTDEGKPENSFGEDGEKEDNAVVSQICEVYTNAEAKTGDLDSNNIVLPTSSVETVEDISHVESEEDSAQPKEVSTVYTRTETGSDESESSNTVVPALVATFEEINHQHQDLTKPKEVWISDEPEKIELDSLNTELPTSRVEAVDGIIHQENEDTTKPKEVSRAYTHEEAETNELESPNNLLPTSIVEAVGENQEIIQENEDSMKPNEIIILEKESNKQHLDETHNVEETKEDTLNSIEKSTAASTMLSPTEIVENEMPSEEHKSIEEKSRSLPDEPESKEEFSSTRESAVLAITKEMDKNDCEENKMQDRDEEQDSLIFKDSTSEPTGSKPDEASKRDESYNEMTSISESDVKEHDDRAYLDEQASITNASCEELPTISRTDIEEDGDSSTLDTHVTHGSVKRMEDLGTKSVEHQIDNTFCEYVEVMHENESSQVNEYIEKNDHITQIPDDIKDEGILKEVHSVSEADIPSHEVKDIGLVSVQSIDTVDSNYKAEEIPVRLAENPKTEEDASVIEAPDEMSQGREQVQDMKSISLQNIEKNDSDEKSQEIILQSADNSKTEQESSTTEDKEHIEDMTNIIFEKPEETSGQNFMKEADDCNDKADALVKKESSLEDVHIAEKTFHVPSTDMDNQNPQDLEGTEEISGINHGSTCIQKKAEATTELQETMEEQELETLDSVKETIHEGEIDEAGAEMSSSDHNCLTTESSRKDVDDSSLSNVTAIIDELQESKEATDLKSDMSPGVLESEAKLYNAEAPSEAEKGEIKEDVHQADGAENILNEETTETGSIEDSISREKDKDEGSSGLEREAILVEPPVEETLGTSNKENNNEKVSSCDIDILQSDKERGDDEYEKSFQSNSQGGNEVGESTELVAEGHKSAERFSLGTSEEISRNIIHDETNEQKEDQATFAANVKVNQVTEQDRITEGDHSKIQDPSLENLKEDCIDTKQVQMVEKPLPPLPEVSITNVLKDIEMMPESLKRQKQQEVTDSNDVPEAINLDPELKFTIEQDPTTIKPVNDPTLDITQEPTVTNLNSGESPAQLSEVHHDHVIKDVAEKEDPLEHESSNNKKVEIENSGNLAVPSDKDSEERESGESEAVISSKHEDVPPITSSESLSTPEVDRLIDCSPVDTKDASQVQEKIQAQGKPIMDEPEESTEKLLPTEISEKTWERADHPSETSKLKTQPAQGEVKEEHGEQKEGNSGSEVVFIGQKDPDDDTNKITATEVKDMSSTTVSNDRTTLQVDPEERTDTLITREGIQVKADESKVEREEPVSEALPMSEKDADGHTVDESFVAEMKHATSSATTDDKILVQGYPEDHSEKKIFSEEKETNTDQDEAVEEQYIPKEAKAEAEAPLTGEKDPDVQKEEKLESEVAGICEKDSEDNWVLVKENPEAFRENVTDREDKGVKSDSKSEITDAEMEKLKPLNTSEAVAESESFASTEKNAEKIESPTPENLHALPHNTGLSTETIMKFDDSDIDIISKNQEEKEILPLATEKQMAVDAELKVSQEKEAAVTNQADEKSSGFGELGSEPANSNNEKTISYETKEGETSVVEHFSVEHAPEAKKEEVHAKNTGMKEDSKAAKSLEHKDEEVKDEKEPQEENIGSDLHVMTGTSRDTEVKVSPKKSHNILSGVIKHSISKMKKAITCTNNQPMPQSPR